MQLSGPLPVLLALQVILPLPRAVQPHLTPQAKKTRARPVAPRTSVVEMLPIAPRTSVALGASWLIKNVGGNLACSLPKFDAGS